MLHSKVIVESMTGPDDTGQVDLQAWMAICTGPEYMDTATKPIHIYSALIIWQLRL